MQGACVLVLAILTAAMWRPGSASAGSLTLTDALARAERDHPGVRAAEADVAAARGRLVQAGVLATNPVVTTDLARHGNSPGKTNLDRGVDLAQEIEVGGQRGLRQTEGRVDLERAEQLLLDRRRTVRGETRRAFAALVAAERRFALVSEAAALATRLREATRRRGHAGDVGGMDVQQAEIDAVRAEQATTLAALERDRTEERLAAALGALLEDHLTVAAGPDPTPAPAAAAALTTRALDLRPDLRAARLARDRLEATATLGRRTALIPTPKFHVFYRQEQDVERIAGGAVELPLPLWDRGQGTALADQAAIVSAAVEVERLEREIPRQVREAAARRTAAAGAWIRFRNEVLPAAEGAARQLERSYATGYLGLPQVLAQRDWFLRARTDAIGAWSNLQESVADLDEAVGEVVP